MLLYSFAFQIQGYYLDPILFGYAIYFKEIFGLKELTVKFFSIELWKL